MQTPSLRSLAVLALILASCSPPAPLAAPAPAQPSALPAPPGPFAFAAAGLAAIRPESVSAHVRFLADDALEGRATGERGYTVAVDNASGCAVLLDVARALASLPARPRRSVLFLFVTGEEKGLLGSSYFAENPTLPLASIVADINVDGALPEWDLHDVEVIGLEHSTLRADVEEAARALGLEVSPDADPKRLFFIRSDQYSFVKHAVPSLFIIPGTKDERGGHAANEAQRAEYMTRRYHQPGDEWRATSRWDQVARFAKLELLLGLSVAMRDARPAWNPGDFYARPRAP